MEKGVIRQAVILSRGDEARPQGGSLAAMSADGEPLVHYSLWNLARHGVTEVLISGGPAREPLASALAAHPVPGISVRFEADWPSLLDERFFVLDERSFLDVNYLDLALRAGDGAAVALRRVNDASGGFCAELTDGMVRKYQPGKAGPGLVFGGVACLSRDMAGALEDGASALERDLLPRLAREGRLAGCDCSASFFDLDDEQARTALPAWKRRPALFLDRDGVLNVNHGYVHTREAWTWCPGAREAIRFANNAGLLVILITNQSGIGRGYYGPEDFHGLMDWVREDLAGIGAHLDAVYHCPHHPTGGVGDYRRECACRKPNPGMVVQALDEWPVDVERSAVVGDSESDLEAGRRVGIRRLRLYDHEQENLLDVVRDVFAFLSDG